MSDRSRGTIYFYLIETQREKPEMNFETIASNMFPEILDKGYISRAQVNQVIDKHPMRYPNHIVNPQNTLKRGIFKFEVGMHVDAAPIILETDDELDQRISETYESLDTLIEAVAGNKVNSLIVSGSPGLGKSYEVNKVLNRINNGEYGFQFSRGYLKATGLFRLLWENRFQGMTIVLDDVDSIMNDEVALNILKSALELKPSRLVGWGSEKEFLSDDGEVIPRYFQYEGNIIFLTNLNFSELASGTTKNAPHLSALESRSLVLDLKIKTKREFIAKIKQTVKGGMLKDKDLSLQEEQDILDFVEEYSDRMKELSLRAVEKLAVLLIMNREDWRPLARTVMLK